jgi:hypothetical protein
MHKNLNTDPVTEMLKQKAQDKQELSLLGCYAALM